MLSPEPPSDRGQSRAHAAPPALAPWRWIAPFALTAVALQLLPLAGNEIPEWQQRTSGRYPIVTIAVASAGAGATIPGSVYAYARSALKATSGGGSEDPGEPWHGNQHIKAINIGPAAASYRFAGRSEEDRLRALSCLTSAIYYEAGSEPAEGQRAVAQVVLNRVRHAQWPNTVCGVVYQGKNRSDLRCQFSFSCNGAMARRPDRKHWAQAKRIAEAALEGAVFAPAGLATFYHALSVSPSWARRMNAGAVIGAHIFYRAPGIGNTPERFNAHYAGIETFAGRSVRTTVGISPKSPPKTLIAEASAIRPSIAGASATVTKAQPRLPYIMPAGLWSDPPPPRGEYSDSRQPLDEAHRRGS